MLKTITTTRPDAQGSSSTPVESSGSVAVVGATPAPGDKKEDATEEEQRLIQMRIAAQKAMDEKMGIRRDKGGLGIYGFS